MHSSYALASEDFAVERDGGSAPLSELWTGGYEPGDRLGVILAQPMDACGCSNLICGQNTLFYDHLRDTRGITELGVIITTPLGAIRAGKVALATNAFKPLLKRLSSFIAPVYDYCMVTQPLTADQMASIGWENRQGLSDLANQFHYYRLTADNRILWGGYDAVYY